ncbi:Glycosyltransferase involved in cell wall bisynthesis [Flavobacterium aquidurense]|uniref:Glycosyl transferase family 2 n=1 Tax=Flavobacterium frigidimaris TaxID=262320 RepID=A0ABX4BUY0_FLAFR|nr:glycosyltransferase family 2 protein [Flavobacterium frigidimaris]OXA81464.1 glycosyl transferase family 2 [Flavobacterium frigidimaris]SDZ05127.1 Glycosyltransferase involved in cell wall bisynthesis [Flavobacterium aquidurense]
MKKKVTIIMATYNRSHFILESLLSIQNQTYSEFECLIIDDGGTDKTLEVITPILNKDSRFKFLKRPENYTKGLPGCRNYGIDLAKGDYIIFFDDDDIVHPQNLELCTTELNKNKVAFCRYQREVFFNEFHYNFDYSKEYSSFKVGVNDVGSILTHELPFNSCAVMWKATCFEKNRFAEHLMYAEEWELYSKIISSGFEGLSINKCLFYGRKHANSNTGEFFQNNPVRMASQADAVILVVQNLKEKKILTDSLIQYFITISIGFKEYNLFNRILNILDLSIFARLKWIFFYQSYPLRLPIYKIKKRFK